MAGGNDWGVGGDVGVGDVGDVADCSVEVTPLQVS
jgi:hypothetical protein